MSSCLVSQARVYVDYRGQQAFATSLFSAYFDGKVQTISDGHQAIPPEVDFKPFHVCPY